MEEKVRLSMNEIELQDTIEKDSNVYYCSGYTYIHGSDKINAVFENKQIKESILINSKNFSEFKINVKN